MGARDLARNVGCNATVSVFEPIVRAPLTALKPDANACDASAASKLEARFRGFESPAPPASQPRGAGVKQRRHQRTSKKLVGLTATRFSAMRSLLAANIPLFPKTEFSVLQGEFAVLQKGDSRSSGAS